MYFTLVAHSTIVMFTQKLPAFGEITKLNKHSTNWNQIEFITFLSQFYNIFYSLKMYETAPQSLLLSI